MRLFQSYGLVVGLRVLDWNLKMYWNLRVLQKICVKRYPFVLLDRSSPFSKMHGCCVNPM